MLKEEKAAVRFTLKKSLARPLTREEHSLRLALVIRAAVFRITKALILYIKVWQPLKLLLAP